MSVWKSEEKLLISASLISPSKIILFEKWYQAFDTSVSSTDEAPWSSSKILCCAHVVFLTLLGVSSGDETLCLMLDIWQLCDRYDKEDDFSEGEGECGYIFKLQYYIGIANDSTVNK